MKDSTGAYIENPALFTSTSIFVPEVSRSEMNVEELGSLTSNCSHFPPLDSISETRGGVLEGVRLVAITV